MEELQLDMLREHLPDLIKVTYVSIPLIARLRYNILSEYDVELIMSAGTQLDRAYRLYEISSLKRNGLECLLNALMHEKQAHPLSILEQAVRETKLLKKLFNNLKRKPEMLNALVNATSADDNESKEKLVLLNVMEEQDSRFTVTNSILISTTQQTHQVGVTRPLSTAFLLGSQDKVIFSELSPLEVVLTRPEKPIRLTKDCYQLPVKKKGLALIVNIIEFDHKKTKNRDAAQPDTRYMEELWTNIGYTVYEENTTGRITETDFKNILNRFRERVKNDKPASTIIFVGSHGVDGAIMTSEGKYVPVMQEIVYKLKSEVCEVLREKPKIFLISACQVFSDDNINARTSVDHASPGFSNIKFAREHTPADDIYIVFSASPGHYSYKDEKLGTWFSYCMTKIFMEHAHNTDFREMVLMTQLEMKQIKAPTEIHYGQTCSYLVPGVFKTLYFNLETARSLMGD